MDAARAAKAHVKRLVADDPRVNGIGLSRSGGGWAVKVNVVDESDYPELPETVDGVLVRVAAIGRVSTTGDVSAIAQVGTIGPSGARSPSGAPSPSGARGQAGTPGQLNSRAS